MVINDTWRRMPDADVLLAANASWWLTRDPRVSPSDDEFLGERLINMKDDRIKNVRYVEPYPLPGGGDGGNSALHAVHEAGRRGARTVLLFGVDLRDDALTHWHGLHARLNNPTAPRFARARKAWAAYGRDRMRPHVINCNPASAVDSFPKMTPEEGIGLIQWAA